MESCTNALCPFSSDSPVLVTFTRVRSTAVHELAQVIDVNAAVTQPARDHGVIDGAADGASRFDSHPH